MRSKLFLVLAAVLMSIGVKAATELYSSYNESKSTLTYYYDDQRSVRQDAGEITQSYNPAVTSPGYDRFSTYYTHVLTGVIDESMKEVRLTSIDKMFAGLERMTSIEGMENLVTDDVTDMYRAFFGCESLKTIDLSHFHTDKVTSMEGLFYECSSLRSVDLSSFNTANVTNMYAMFFGCYSLKSLNLTQLNIAKVTEMGEMFMGCNTLKTIYCNDDWSKSAANSLDMFKDCRSLAGEFGTQCDGKTNIGKTYARPDGGEGDEGYFTPTNRPVEVYTSFNESNSTLTYYCDDQRLARTIAGETTEIYDPVHHPDAKRLKGYDVKVKKATVDVSMKDTLLTSTRKMFAYLDRMTQLEGLENLHTDNVTDMSEMFVYCKALKSLDLSHFNTAKVKDMSGMFKTCIKLSSLNVSHFSTAKVTDMSEMFRYCESLKSVYVGSFNTENVTDMSEMFSGCTSLQTLDLSDFNTTNVTNMYGMFARCESLVYLDLNPFNTAKVTDMTVMFYGCKNLTTIYCNNSWSKSSVLEKSHNMFKDCKKLKGIQGTTYSEDHADASYAHPDGVRGAGYFGNTKEIYTAFETPTGVMTYYFDGLRSGRTGICELYTPEKWNDIVRFAGYADKVKKVVIDESLLAVPLTSLANMFDGGSDETRLSALESIENLGNINCTEVTSMYSMFRGCSSLKSIDLDPLHDAEHVYDLSFMFEGCSSLRHLDLRPLSTANVTNMYSLCAGCPALEDVVLYSFNTSGVTDMGYMFFDCSSLTELDLRSFDTEKVEWMPGMFSGCSSLEIVRLNSFNTSNVESMSEMFKGCTALTSLDLRPFKTDNVRFMDEMFKGCSYLTTILCLDNWNGSDKLESSYDMFDGCFDLVGYQGTACNGNLTDVTYARLDGGASDPGYFSITNEVYTVYDPKTTTLTYYCDDRRASRTYGVVELYDPDDTEQVRFKDYHEDVDYIVLDESMRGAVLTSMHNMFYGGREYDEPTDTYTYYTLHNVFAIAGLEYLSTDDVTSMSYMFYGCAALKELDFGTFHIANVVNTSHMFDGCSNLNTIYSYEDWNASEKLMYSDDMFAGCYSLEGDKDTSCDGENTIDKSYARPDGIEGPGYFTALKRLYSVYEENIATLTYYYDDDLPMREGIIEYYNPNGHDIPRLKGYVKQIKYVVIDPSLRSLRSKSLANMFDGMTSLESIEGLEFIDYCAVTDMYAMFRNCASLKELDLTPVKTNQVRNFNGMFYGCSSLKELDITGFDTGKAWDMSNMFAYCSKLVTLRSDKDWSKYGIPCKDMFLHCSSLVGRKGTKCNGYDQIANMLARPDGGEGDEGYFTQSLVTSKKGYFSINDEGGRIQFSPGNLQFNAAKGTHDCADGTTKNGTWRFAPNQWNCIGEGNENISESYDGWIDLFGWATSGWNNGAKEYQPWSAGTEYNDYLKDNIGLADFNEVNIYGDWGLYNQIGDDAPGTWRTLSPTEWKYILNERPLAGNLRGHGVVNGVKGYILLPDDWITPNCLSFEWSSGGSPGTTDWYANVYDGKDWEAMEEAGAVFLPAAGYRNNQALGGLGQYGYYWSNGVYNGSGVHYFYLFFMSSDISSSNSYYNYEGRSVRLVKAYEAKPEITAEQLSDEEDKLTVTITPVNIDSKVYYTVVVGDTKDVGEDMSALTWIEYTDPFEIDPKLDYGETKYYTVLAYSVNADGVKSDMATDEYSFSMPGKLAEPVITTSYHSQRDKELLVMMSAEAGATIRYMLLRTDFEPSDNDIKNLIASGERRTYMGDFYVHPSTAPGQRTYVTIIAYATAEDFFDSEYTQVQFEFFNPIPPAVPQISSDYAGESSGSVTFTINADEGTTIWYKIEISGEGSGSGEEENEWKQYGEPITVNPEVDYGETKTVTVYAYAEKEDGSMSEILIESFTFSKPEMPLKPAIITKYESPKDESASVLLIAEEEAIIKYAVIPLSYDEDGNLIDVTDYSKIDFTLYEGMFDIVPEGPDGTRVAYKLVAYAKIQGIRSNYATKTFEFDIPEEIDAPAITSDYKDPKAETITVTVTSEEGAKIYYTVFIGDEQPAVEEIDAATWLEYNGPFDVTPGTGYGETKIVTVLAYAEKNDVQSETAKAEYEFALPVVPAKPVISSDYASPEDEDITVSVSAEAGTDIWYKILITDTKPTDEQIDAAQWKPYTDAIEVNPEVGEGETKYVTILAYADNDGVPSQIEKVEYVFSKPEPVLCPEFMLADEKGEPFVETLNISLGETFVAPQVVLLTEGFKFSVSYSSSNEEVAAVNDFGEIEIVGVGEAVISANVNVEGISHDDCSIDDLVFNLVVDEPEQLEPLPADQVTDFDFSLYDPTGSEILGLTLGAEDQYNPDLGHVVVATTNNADEIDQKLNDVFEGGASIKNFLPGTITFQLPAGEGTIEIDCQTLPGYVLKVRIAEYGEAFITSTVEQALRGKATVNYSVTQKTLVVIYLEATSGAATPARIARSEKEEGAGAYVYAIKITPKSAPTAFDNVEPSETSIQKQLINGVLYIERNGQRYDATGRLVK